MTYHKVSTYIESPEQMDMLIHYSFESLIIDCSFCSIRPFNQYDWSLKELIQLKQNVRFNALILNLDGLYSDDELAIIYSSIKHLGFDTVFDGFRIQDPGLHSWISDYFPHMSVQLNTETGAQHPDFFNALSNTNISTIIFNPDIPYSDLKSMQNGPLNYEIYVQGPLLIQYSRRQFLSDWYNTDAKRFHLTAEDPDFSNRPFTFLNTNFGHFMFAHFHRSLAKYHEKLTQLNMSFLIDYRGESKEYQALALDLFHNLTSMTDDIIQKSVDRLATLSNKPQRAGFFLSNNTDYDWRDYGELNRPNEPVIGLVLHSKKQQEIIIEWRDSIIFPKTLTCINPDQSIQQFTIEHAMRLDESETQQAQSFEILIHPWTKGIQKNGKLYVKDSQ